MTDSTRETVLYAAIWTGIAGYVCACVVALYLTGWLGPVIGCVVILSAVVAISEQYKEQQVQHQARARRWRQW